MLYKEDKVKQTVEEFLKEAGLSQKVTRISYRPDYMDYQVVLDGTHHCELREKLFQIHFTNNDKDGDAKREVKYLLQNAMEYEDWEKENEAGPPSEDRIGVDDTP
jgi:hypothetical protein